MMHRCSFKFVISSILLLLSVSGYAAKPDDNSKPKNADIVALQTAVAQLQADNESLKEKVAALEANNIAGLSSVLSFDESTKNVLFNGANVQIVNGLGNTNRLNGLGNLTVGYNESPEFGEQVEHCSYGRNTPIKRSGVDLKAACSGDWGRNMRVGSHNIIVGSDNDYTSFGGFVAGLGNVINADFSTVTGGTGNIASGQFSSISGGQVNRALNRNDSVSGGWGNQVYGFASSISGGSGTILNSTGGHWAVGKATNGLKYPEQAVVE